MIPDYQLEDTKRQAAFEKSKQEPKEHCFKCGKEIEPEELIEYYDLAFCGQSCLDRAMQCPECGEQAEEPGDYCAGCAEKNRIYIMSDPEFWGLVNTVTHLASGSGLRVSKEFYSLGDELELVWSCPVDAPIRSLARLFAARGIKYRKERPIPACTLISITLVGGKYQEA